MNYLKSTIITQAGHELIVRGQVDGTDPVFTRAEVGAGKYTDADTMAVLESMTALRDPRQEFPLANIQIKNKTNIYISFVATNHDDTQTLTEGTYPMLEIGIYAKDPDNPDEEILYALALADPSHPDWMPTYNGSLPAITTYHIMVEVSNAENVTLEGGGGVYALADDLDSLQRQVDGMIPSGTIPIPHRAWQDTDDGAAVHIPLPAITDEYIPHVIVSDAGAEASMQAGMELICEAGDGELTIHALAAPTEDIEVSVTMWRRTRNITVVWPELQVRDPGTFTAADFAEIMESGKALEYLHPGDPTPLLPLNGTIGDLTLEDYLARFRIMDFYDSRPIFMLWENEAGQPICLVPSNYASTYVEANATGICMNRKGQIGNTVDSSLDTNAKTYGPNKGGWEPCYDRLAAMPQAKLLLPEEWQALIIPTTIWTDNVGNATNAASSITSTTDYCFLPDECELFGTNTYGNQYCNQKQKQWAYSKAGNSLKANRHDQPTTAANWFGRGPCRSYTSSFCGVDTNGTASTLSAAYTYGLRFCFRI